MKIFLTSIIVAIIALTGCMGSKPSPYEKPDWVYNPGSGGAVGISHKHVKGLSAQRNLSITRALSELTMQQGAEVSYSGDFSEKYTNDVVKTSGNSKTIINAKNKVTAHAQQWWLDRKTQELYVWMVID